jgi:hypothetical protein
VLRMLASGGTTDDIQPLQPDIGFIPRRLSTSGLRIIQS